MYANLFLALNYTIGRRKKRNHHGTDQQHTQIVRARRLLTDVAVEEVLSVFMRICTGVVTL